MKSSIITLVAMLICLAMASTALAACPPGTANCLEVYDGSGGEVIGDDNFAAENSLDDITNNGATATVTSGVTAAVNIPVGSQGLVALAIDRYNDQTSNPILANNQQYFLNAAFKGNIKLGAEKTSDAGTETAQATIFSRATADVNTGLSGQATIETLTTSDGTGATYAIVDDAAATYKAKRVCPTCPNVNNEIAGESSARNVELRSCNAECTDFNCVNPAPAGIKRGAAVITTASNSNGFTSTSTSEIALQLAASRGNNKGTSAITGVMNFASAASRARDQASPVTSTGWNSQTTVRADKFDASAYAFAVNDATSATGVLISQATNTASPLTTVIDTTNTAVNAAEVQTAVVRSNLNNPGTFAKAAVNMDNAYFAADGRDLRTSQKYAFERATIADMSAKGQLGKVSNIRNVAVLELAAQRNGNDALATITNQVQNFGPKTGSANDFSEVHELASNLRAEAKSNAETRFVNILSKRVDSKITGLTGSPIAPANQAIITGTSTSAKGLTTTVALVQRQKIGVNNIWTLNFQKINN